MLFNSIAFAIFLPLVFILYWFVVNKNLRLQNLLLLVVSYVFYGWWDWRFLSLIFISSMTDYVIGTNLYITKKNKKRKLLLFLSLFINIGFLGFFKYYNFFIDSFINAFTTFGINLHPRTLHIILPVGISFYTFQTLSYTLDIYKKKIKPTKDIINFFAFVSFFPQLVAGPIERAKNLLPQFEKKRSFNYDVAKDGMRQILWGLFKKVAIADTLAVVVDYIFNNSNSMSGSVLIIGVIFFAFQIYCDFSGYSDIAIGIAHLFKFNLMQNFAFPYFSRNIAEFWRRWHISLSSWFKDYVYIPLGGSYVSKIKQIRNIIITFTVSGFWHGANWTFVFWGFLNGLYYIPSMLVGKKKKDTKIVAAGKIFPKFKEILSILLTFGITLFAWIFFRAENIKHAFTYIEGIMSKSIFSLFAIEKLCKTNKNFIPGLILIVILVIIEWLQREKQHALQFEKTNIIVRWIAYFIIGFAVIYFFNESKTFIYFQF